MNIHKLVIAVFAEKQQPNLFCYHESVFYGPTYPEWVL